MIRILIVIFISFHSSIAFGQGAFISPDSSRLIFPNNVAIDLTRNIRKGKSAYELSPLAMRTLLVQYNFVNASLTMNQEHSKLLEKELIRKDSMLVTLREQLHTTTERLNLYSKGFQDLKSVSVSYDNQIKRLIADLAHAEKENRKSNRKKFFQGMAAGLVVTAVYVIISD